jgi:hypothetical protein
MSPRPELAMMDTRIGAELSKLSKQGRTHIFVACMPKTASTFINSVLRRLTGFSAVHLILALDNEQDIYVPSFMRMNNTDTVTFQHVRATPSNLFLLQSAGIKPIITARSFFDVVVSLRDMVENEQDRPFFNVKFPYTREFLKMDRERQLDAIIDIFMPWFFAFYISWHDACRYGQFDAAWLTYGEFSEDKVRAISAILSYYKICRSPRQIQNAFEASRKPGNRINKGVKGRGSEQLSQAQKQRLLDMANYYPWVDFSLVGIDRPVENLQGQQPRPFKRLFEEVPQQENLSDEDSRVA